MSQCNFFRTVTFSKCVSALIFDGFFTLLAFAPDLLPLSHLGSSGFYQNLVDDYSAGLTNFWWFLFGLHLAEAFIVLRLCTDRGITDGTTHFLWFFQTLFFGYLSMELLFDFHPDRQKQK